MLSKYSYFVEISTHSLSVLKEQISFSNAFGSDSGRVPRVPIPNTTVKPSSADGTWTAGSWESRTLPSATLMGISHKSFLFLRALSSVG